MYYEDFCARTSVECGDAHTITSQLYGVVCAVCRLERSFRVEGALSMRAPEDVVGIRLYGPARLSLWHVVR